MEVPIAFCSELPLYLLNFHFDEVTLEKHKTGGGAPSLPLYVVKNTCTDGKTNLQKDSFVLLLTGPGSPISQVLLLFGDKLKKVDFQNERGPKPNGPSYFGYVLTTKGAICSIRKVDIIKASIEHWENYIIELFSCQTIDTSLIKQHFTLIALGKDQFVDKGLAIFVEAFQNELTKYHSDFSESSWKIRDRLAKLIDVLYAFCKTRSDYSPAKWKNVQNLHVPSYAPREEGRPFAKGWARETYSASFLEMLQQCLCSLETALHANSTLYFVENEVSGSDSWGRRVTYDTQRKIEDLESCFRDVPELKDVLRKIQMELHRRKEAIKNFDLFMGIFDNMLEAVMTKNTMPNVDGSYSEPILDHFLFSLISLSSDDAAQKIRSFLKAIFVHPSLFLTIEANKKTFLGALKTMGRKNQLDVDWDSLISLDEINDFLRHWYSIMSIDVYSPRVYSAQSKLASFAVRAFLRGQSDQIPLSEDPFDARKYLIQQLEYSDIHAMVSILRAIGHDPVYETTFFEILDDLMQARKDDDQEQFTRHAIIGSGIVWPTVALVFETFAHLNTQKNIQTIYKLFRSSINSLLLFSSLNVFYSKIKTFLSEEHREEIECLLKKRQAAEQYFTWFFDYEEYYAVAPPTISSDFEIEQSDDAKEFKRYATSHSYIFFGCFCTAFLAADQKKHVVVLNYLRDVLYRNRILRKLFTKKGFRKVVYSIISTCGILTSIDEIRKLFEKDWAQVYAIDIIGKPNVGHFKMSTLEMAERLGKQTFLVRVPRMPKPAVAIKFGEDFDFAQHELDRLLRVQGHPHVVRLFGFIVENDDHVGILVENCEGGSLQTYLQSPNVKVHEKEVLSWSQQASSGLLFLHSNNIVHRAVATKIMMLNWKKVIIAVVGRSENSREALRKSVDSISNEENKEFDVFCFGFAIVNMITRIPKYHAGPSPVFQSKQSFFEPSKSLEYLVTRMTTTDLSARPTMHEVYEDLTLLVKGEEIVKDRKLDIVPVESEKRPIRLQLMQNIVGDVQNYLKFKCVTELILVDVPQLHTVIERICELTNLTYLDVSQSTNDREIYPTPLSTTFRILESLKRLEKLEVSSTNLISSETDEENQFLFETLNARANTTDPHIRKLRFLGIVNCECGLASTLPIEQVAGTATEDQILTAFHVNLEREGRLVHILEKTGTFYCTNKNCKIDKRNSVVNCVLQSLKIHNSNVELQRSGLSCLNIMCFGQASVPISVETKSQVVNTLLSALEHHYNHDDIVFYFVIWWGPLFSTSDVFSAYYNRLVKICTNLLQNDRLLVQRSAIARILEVHVFQHSKNDIELRALVLSEGFQAILKFLENQFDSSIINEATAMAMYTLNTIIICNWITDYYEVIRVTDKLNLVLANYTLKQLVALSDQLTEEVGISLLGEISKLREGTKALVEKRDQHVENASTSEDVDNIENSAGPIEENSKEIVQTKELRSNEECMDELMNLFLNLTPTELESSTKEQHLKAVNLTTEVIQKFPDGSVIKTKAANALYNILFFAIRHLTGQEYRKLLLLLLTEIEHNGQILNSIWLCACLTRFDLKYFEAQYRRIFAIAQNLLIKHADHPAALEWGLSLFYNLSTVVKQRQLLGILGGIEIAVSMFFVEMEENKRPYLLQLLMSFLVSVTDELPSNCYRVMEITGNTFFEEHLENCIDDSTIIQILIVMSNIAEVEFLRKRLLNPHLLTTLLMAAKNSFHIMFPLSQLLSLLLLDDWAEIHIDKTMIEEVLIQSVLVWDLTCDLAIMYNTPIIFQRLLADEAPTASQFFAIWTLRHLTAKDPDRYCPMLVKSGFFLLLSRFAAKPDTNVEDPTVELTRAVYQTLKTFYKKQNEPRSSARKLSTIFEAHPAEQDTNEDQLD